ncbi:UPF0182 family protein [Humidisolicoccus flavus]|uniref:UPF0182 family membrane protein n=1 Tax=Humidisolicoccus flavus TaxID=3111414 RepID=UPI00324BD7CC
MSETSATTTSAPRGRRSPLVITLAIVAAILVGFYFISGFLADVFWFDQLGFLGVLQTRWISIGVMFAIGFVAMAVPLWLSIQVAFRARPVYAQLNSQLDRYQELIEPLRRVAMIGIPIVFGLFAGVATSSRWESAQLWLNRQSFGEGQVDAQFGLNVGFYVFELPFYQSAVAFIMSILFACAVATLATSYLYGAIRITGRDVRIARGSRIQLAVLAALYMAALAASIWLGQYATVVQSSTGGDVPTGVGFTEANAIIPGQQILAGIAALIALLFIVTAVLGRWKISLVGTALLVVASLVVGLAYPALIQRFQVLPSARSLESEFIERNIQATQTAYGVDGMIEETYDAKITAEAGALRDDAATTTNIRILDPALVTEAFANLQEYRQYYGFPEILDVGRYEIDGQVQDTVLAVRELDPDFIEGQSWYNSTIVYTHGFGLVAAYGNQRGTEGQPVFMQSGIPPEGELGEFEPRIYFGESSPEYSIVGGNDRDLELDYPLDQDSEESSNAYYTFEGDGGPKLDNVLKRLIYAIKFQSEQILFSDAVTDGSQILYDRDPRERVQKVAPFLTLDNDTYPAVVDGRIVWIVDGFTTSNMYPYSKQIDMLTAISDTYNNPQAVLSETINYLRNSVKAVVDAADGSVTLYAWDIEDPILKAWMQIYPDTVKPMEEMSGELLSQVRYPSDLFKVQRYILGDYHVNDPGTFYSGDDEWVTPNEPTADNNETARLQPPYYLTMKVGEQDPAFTIYSTFIPKDGRNVLYGYLSANADAGSTQGEIADTYGQLTLQLLPKSRSIPGPGQVQNTFDTDDTIAIDLNILREGQSNVELGNLLTLPVGGGLLYVQPVYLKSTGATSFPVLRKVMVAFGNNIAFEDTLDQALDALFEGDSGAAAGDEDIVPGTDPDDSEGVPTDPEGEGTGGAEMSPELQQALNEASQALQDREDAYAANDLVAAAEADTRLQAAIAKALELSE